MNPSPPVAVIGRAATGLLLMLAALANAQQPLVYEALDVADARWHDAVVVPSGAVGAAAHFDGAQAHIDVGPCPVADDRAFTLHCRLRTTRGAFCTPLMARDGDTVGLSLVIGREPGLVSFEAWSWQQVRLRSRTRVDDGAWHTIEVPYDPATNVAALFVDGELQASAELGPGRCPGAKLRLGDNIGAHQPFAGDLDELRVLAGTTRLAALRAVSPVLPRSERHAALRALRERLLPRHTPGLAAEPAAAWPARRAAVRAHVAEAIGLLPAPAPVPLEVTVHGELVRDGVRLQRLSWTGFAGQRATGWSWSPAGPATTPAPAVLCPHGHWQGGATHPVVQARCATFAQFGWRALAVDSVHVEHLASGVNSIGVMTWHNQRAIDLLVQCPEVDAQHIAVTGASGGGQQTCYLMALEDRLAAAAPVVMACYFAEILDDTSAHCGCNHPPRLASGSDVPELCAVFAPRPAFFGSVTGDWTHDFPQHGLPELRAHWTRLGGHPPASRHGDEGHNYDRAMREAVYAFLREALHAPGPSAEPGFRPFSVAELAPLLASCPPAALAADVMAAPWLARRPAVGDWRELAPGLDFALPIAPLHWRDEPGTGWRRGTVTGTDGVAVPLRWRAGDAAGATVVVVDPAGAAAAAEAAATLPSTNPTVLVDPRPYGEWAPFRAAWQRNGLLLGRGEGYQAALDVATVCHNLPGAAPVHLVGRGEAGVVVLLAATLCDRVTKVRVDDLGPTFADDGNRRPACPEVLRYGDLDTLCQAVAARCELAVVAGR